MNFQEGIQLWPLATLGFSICKQFQGEAGGRPALGEAGGRKDEESVSWPLFYLLKEADQKWERVALDGKSDPWTGGSDVELKHNFI